MNHQTSVNDLLSYFFCIFHLNQSCCTLPPPSNLHLINWHLPVTHWNCKQTTGGIFLAISKALLIETHKLSHQQKTLTQGKQAWATLSHVSFRASLCVQVSTTTKWILWQAWWPGTSWLLLPSVPTWEMIALEDTVKLAGGRGELISSLGVTVTYLASISALSVLTRLS